jgi:hypothetical protein
MEYYKDQIDNVIFLLKNCPELFNGDCGNGIFRKKNRPFVLQHCKNNIYQPIASDAIKYFRENKISWWGGSAPTGHTLSSQISCINHLFPIRHDKNSVLEIVKKVCPNFIDVLPITTDTTNTVGYIQFEAVSNIDHLNEGQLSRGKNCTSIDALIYAKHSNCSKYLIIIEWKYIEKGYKDKSNATRRKRYTDLIQCSKQLINGCPIYYYEPFYQLMRQTLWAEQMIKNKGDEILKADCYYHINIIPDKNTSLLNKKYPSFGLDMKQTWQKCIRDQNKYRIISPKDFLSPIINDKKYASLICYLSKRYWN